MDIYPLTEARKRLGELVNMVKYQKQVIALGKNGKAEVFIVAIPQEEDIPIMDICAQSTSFSFLDDEPDIYSVDDLKERYV